MLVHLRPKPPVSAVQMFMSRLHDDDPKVVEVSLQGLAQSISQSAAAKEAVLSSLRPAEARSTRLAALKVLGYYRAANPEVLYELQQLLQDSDPEVVRSSIRAIGIMGKAASGLQDSLQKFIDRTRSPEDSALASEVLRQFRQ